MQLLHTLPIDPDDYVDWMQREHIDGEEVLLIHTQMDRRFVMRVVPDGTTITELLVDGTLSRCLK